MGMGVEFEGLEVVGFPLLGDTGVMLGTSEVLMTEDGVMMDLAIEEITVTGSTSISKVGFFERIVMLLVMYGMQ
jgi:hypothetical protein